MTAATIRERVIKARQIQTERFSSLPKQGGQRRVHCNAQMTDRMLHQFAEPDAASMDMLRMAMEKLKHSELTGLRLSMKPWISQGWLECIPLYAFREELIRKK